MPLELCSPTCTAPHALSLALAPAHVLCTQAYGVAVSGSYAYVAAHGSDSLVVVDISNPASPVIRGNVVSSSLLDNVRVQPRALRALMASGVPRLRPHRPSFSPPRCLRR
jgi:hypothetical protein